MKKQELSREEIIEEWLDLYPLRQHQFELEEDGKIVILVPHPENWLTKKIFPKPKNPGQKIHLDEMGSLVWNLFDGKKSIRHICEELSKNPKEPADSIEERTVLFAQQMYKQKFIKVFTKKDGESTGSSADNTRQRVFYIIFYLILIRLCGSCFLTQLINRFTSGCSFKWSMVLYFFSSSVFLIRR